MGRSVQKECGIAPFIILPLCLGLGNTSITCVSSASQKIPNQLFKQGSPISQVEPLDHFGPSVAVYNSTSALRSERGTVADTVREKKIRTVVVRRKGNISFFTFFHNRFFELSFRRLSDAYRCNLRRDPCVVAFYSFFTLDFRPAR